MAFRERFDRYVCEGDSIAVEIDGFRVTARIVRDDCPDSPDERQGGFWPSRAADEGASRRRSRHGRVAQG